MADGTSEKSMTSAMSQRSLRRWRSWSLGNAGRRGAEAADDEAAGARAEDVAEVSDRRCAGGVMRRNITCS